MGYYILGGIVLYILIVIILFKLLVVDLNKDDDRTYAFDNSDWFGIWMCAIIFPVALCVLLKTEETKEDV